MKGKELKSLIAEIGDDDDVFIPYPNHDYIQSETAAEPFELIEGKVRKQFDEDVYMVVDEDREHLYEDEKLIHCYLLRLY